MHKEAGAAAGGGISPSLLLDVAIFAIITFATQQMFVHLNNVSYSTYGTLRGFLVYMS